MLTHTEARAAIAAITPLTVAESVPLARAHGRWLAADVLLDRDQPAFDRATMDGYAVVLAEDGNSFTVCGTVTAGMRWAGAPLRAGEAVRIMTGAPAPTGTTVIPIECTDRGDTPVTITAPEALRPRRNIAWQGEDGHAGDCVLRQGTRLQPTTLALAAMAGSTAVPCWRTPSCAIVTTGDEVGGDLNNVNFKGDYSAHIADSNGPLLASLLSSLGIAYRQWHARDEPGELGRVLSAAALEADIVITTGGVSAGAKDLVPDLAQSLGFATVFHHVAIQPGKPVFLARRDAPRGAASALIGLPGNPVSVLATAHLYLLPLLGRFCGGWLPQWLQLPLTVPWQNPGKRHQFMPARFESGGIAPIRWNGSGDLIAAATGHGLIELPIGFSGTPGTIISFLPFVSSGSVADTAILPFRT